MDPRVRSVRIFFPCAIFIALCFAFLFKGCGGGGGGGGSSEDSSIPSSTTATVADGGTIQSSDSRVTVSVQAGALAEDTEISISGDENDSFLNYTLEPDGLEFQEAVTLTINLDNDHFTGIEDDDGNTLDLTNSAFGFPIILESSDGDLEILEGVKYSTDLGSATMAITAKLAHFSTVRVEKVGGIEKSMTVLSLTFESPINEMKEFKAEVALAQSFEEDASGFTTLLLQTKKVLNSANSPVSVEIGDDITVDVSLTPSNPKSDLTSATLSCEDDGDGTITAKVQYDISLQTTVEGKNIAFTRDEELEVIAEVECKATSVVLGYTHGTLKTGSIVDLDCVSNSTIATNDAGCTNCETEDNDHLHDNQEEDGTSIPITIQDNGTFDDLFPSSCGHGCVKSFTNSEIKAAGGLLCER